MKLGIPPSEFNSYSNNKKKNYIARLLITESGAKPIPDGVAPMAFIMAGLPGAGKTEFLDIISE